jgi:hypothetical protein
MPLPSYLIAPKDGYSFSLFQRPDLPRIEGDGWIGSNSQKDMYYIFTC